MDLATLIGAIGAYAIVVVAMILAGGLPQFIDIPSILIVLIGSHFIVIMKHTFPQFVGGIKVGLNSLSYKSENLQELIDKIVELADKARKGGLLSLEGAEIPNSFMKKGIGLLIDGHGEEVVSSILHGDVKLSSQRHEDGAAVFKSLADIAPAMGMIGTLVGLVGMLANMDDPKSIGPAMAIAILTTLYGALMANMMAIPVREKLLMRNEEDKLANKLIIDGLLSIQAGQNPRVIEQLLQGYLPEKSRPVAEE
ncbi:MAG: flagellar motor protein PomA [Gammaproteobacteria bacterium CG22_combo_CG10-13_8_21_14_all_40_8]|nr:MAG: flagellar motor protein PomA [Gammaproteobacteria bacterium CG22_combo_CG10-13_8_21_14_all_40_8]